MSYAFCFNLDQSKILSSGEGTVPGLDYKPVMPDLDLHCPRKTTRRNQMVSSYWLNEERLLHQFNLVIRGSVA